MNRTQFQVIFEEGRANEIKTSAEHHQQKHREKIQTMLLKRFEDDILNFC